MVLDLTGLPFCCSLRGFILLEGVWGVADKLKAKLNQFDLQGSETDKADSFKPTDFPAPKGSGPLKGA